MRIHWMKVELISLRSPRISIKHHKSLNDESGLRVGGKGEWIIKIHFVLWSPNIAIGTLLAKCEIGPMS